MATATGGQVSGIRGVIDAISRDPAANEDPDEVARALRILYAGDIEALIIAMGEMLADKEWSQDREPYRWLEGVMASDAFLAD